MCGGKICCAVHLSCFPITVFCLVSSACGGSHHAVRAEAAEDADGADHLPVQVCLPSPHPVPQELSPHLSHST